MEDGHQYQRKEEDMDHKAMKNWNRNGCEILYPETINNQTITNT